MLFLRAPFHCLTSLRIRVLVRYSESIMRLDLWTETGSYKPYSDLPSPLFMGNAQPPGRGVGGEGSTPHHAPLPPDVLAFARKLRKEQTDAERLMWSLLRDRRLAGCKFRRRDHISRSASVCSFRSL